MLILFFFFFVCFLVFFFFKQKTAYEIVSRDWSSDVCSSDLEGMFVISLVACFAVNGLVPGSFGIITWP